MNKKGQLITDVNIKIISVVFIIGLLGYGVYHFYGIPIGIAKLIPGFNYTENTNGMSIVGINLAQGDRLEYFNGEKWKTVPKGDNFVLGNYDFKPITMKQEIDNFYFNTPRKPDKFNLEINSWRYWVAETGDFNYGKSNYFFRISSHIKKGFKVKDTYNEPIYFDDKSSEIVKVDYSFYVLAFYEHNKYKDKFIKTIEWRDSILSGNKCEKFMNFSNLKENEQPNTKKYAVRKVDNYIFVDFNIDSEGKKQNYDADKCFGDEDVYEDKEMKIIKEPEEIKFVFLRRKAYDFLESNKIEILKYSKEDNGIKNWRFSHGDQLNSIINSNMDLNLYVQVKYLNTIYKELNNRGYFGKTQDVLHDNTDFIESFVLLTRPDTGLFWQNSATFDLDPSVEGVYINNKKIDGWGRLLSKINGVEFDGDLNDASRSEFTYEILDAYYSKYEFEQEQTLNE